MNDRSDLVERTHSYQIKIEENEYVSEFKLE